MLTIWVHVVPGHLWGGEPLLERVCAVTILIHGDQLLLWRSQRCEGVHHPFHAIGHHLYRSKHHRKCQESRPQTHSVLTKRKQNREVWLQRGNPAEESLNSSGMSLPCRVPLKKIPESQFLFRHEKA